MALDPTLEQWMKNRQEARAKAAAQQRAEFFATRTDIPDLEFCTPDCPVCGENTMFDDGQFLCDGCRIAWPNNGYGHQAQRWDDE